MELKPGYKQTEAGIIPKDWITKPLLEAVTIATGQVSPRAEPYKSMVLVAPDHIESQTGTLIELKTASVQGAISGKYLFRSGDIVYSKIRPYLRKAFLADFNGLCSADMYPLTPKPDACAAFVLALLLGERFSKFAESVSVRSGIPKINREELAEFVIPFPPLLEQRAIAAALSDTDALLSSLDRLLAKKRDIKQAVMQQLLTSKHRLPGFSGEWEVKRLGEIGEVASAGVDKKIRPDEVSVRLVNYLDVYKKDFIFSKDLNHVVTATPIQASRCQVRKGDVFFTPSSEVRDDIAHSAVAMEDIQDAVYSYHVVRLRLSDAWDLRFRAYAFKTKAFFDQAHMLCDGSGTRYVISQGKFRTMTVLVPPFPEQTVIAGVLSEMDAEIDMLTQRRDKTRALKQGMMQELLTGRTRLV